MIHLFPPTFCLLLGITCLPRVSDGPDRPDGPEKSAPAARVVPAKGVAARLPNGKEFRTFDVSDLVGQLGDAPLPSVYLAFDSPNGIDLVSALKTDSLFRTRAKQLIESDSLNELVRATVEPRSWDAEDVRLEVRDATLEVIHESAVLDEVEGFLENLRLAIAPRFRVRCIAWKPMPGNPVKTRELDRDAARDFARKLGTGELGSVVYDSQSECRSGSREHFARADTVRYQVDLECEVAEGVSIYKPVVRSVNAGIEFWVQPIVDAAHEGVSLFGLFRARDVDDIKTREFPRLGASLELGSCEQGTTVFSAWLAGGGALVTSSGDYGVFVLVDRVDPRPQRRSGFRALASGDHYHRNLARISGTTSDDTAFSIGYFREDLDYVLDQTRAVAQFGELDGESADSTGWAMLFRGEDKKLDQIEKFLVVQQRREQSNYAVELRTEWLPVSLGAERWQTHGAPLELVCASRKLAVALHGDQRDYVADSEVEIAQKEAITDPVVDSIFLGKQAIVSVAPAGESVRVEIAALARELLEMRSVRSPSDKSAQLDCPQTSDAFYTRKMRVELGKDFVLGSGPRVRVGDSEYRTRLVLQVRKL